MLDVHLVIPISNVGENRQIFLIANIRRDPNISNKKCQLKYANSRCKVRDVQILILIANIGKNMQISDEIQKYHIWKYQ